MVVQPGLANDCETVATFVCRPALTLTVICKVATAFTGMSPTAQTPVTLSYAPWLGTEEI